MEEEEEEGRRGGEQKDGWMNRVSETKTFLPQTFIRGLTINQQGRQSPTEERVETNDEKEKRQQTQGGKGGEETRKGHKERSV